MFADTGMLSVDFAPHLSQQDLGVLLSRARPTSFRKRDPIFTAGDRSQGALLITKGQVKLFRMSEDGREVIFRYSAVGEIIGLAELLSNSRRETCAEAQLSTEVYAIPRGAMLDFMQQRPEVALRAIGVLAARVRSLEEALTNLASDNVEIRLLRLLDRMALLGELQPDGRVLLDFPYTHQDVANQITASRQTVSSIFSEFKRRGVIESVGRAALLFQSPDDERRH